jgi:hypothetical protein
MDDFMDFIHSQWFIIGESKGGCRLNYIITLTGKVADSKNLIFTTHLKYTEARQ